VANVWSIVVAGGAGTRFGAPKQYALLGGRPVVARAVAACRAVSSGVVLVVPAGAARADGPAGADPERHGADLVVTGGATRAESVRCGLAAVPAEAEVIVVHDAVRPLASPALFRAVVEAVCAAGADGVVPGLPPSDTIKVVDEDGQVTSTLVRSTLVAVQTPQAFRAPILRRAHEAARADATDDAMVVEALGGRVRVVPGEPGNLKITDPGDLEVAERLLVSGEA
jgi:2-C-methyl-D-erythritol 4-phosphate cytidylyltransferase